MKTETRRICETCDHWASREESALGDCRRQPPVHNPAWDDKQDRSYGWEWPLTLKTEWCGEWWDREHHERTGGKR